MFDTRDHDNDFDPIPRNYHRCVVLSNENGFLMYNMGPIPRLPGPIQPYFLRVQPAGYYEWGTGPDSKNIRTLHPIPHGHFHPSKLDDC
jgi:hypothetical protein